MIEINIPLMLEFFDEAVPSSQHHATAIVAIAGEDMGAGLLLHYFRQKNITAEILPKLCTQGTRSGVRLDRWILATQNKKRIYYQTEIKNWSAHAFGGESLKITASPQEIKAHKIERWEKEWDGSTFRKIGARKVLTPMEKPEQNCIVEPLICYWDAMHPKGKDEPLFSVPLQNQHFSRVWVFSMSTYFRNLLSSSIRKVSLDMPDSVKRINWLDSLFSIS